MDKLDLVKINNFCSYKDSVINKKWKATDWKKIYMSDKRLLFKIYKEKLINKKIK